MLMRKNRFMLWLLLICFRWLIDDDNVVVVVVEAFHGIQLDKYVLEVVSFDPTIKGEYYTHHFDRNRASIFLSHAMFGAHYTSLPMERPYDLYGRRRRQQQGQDNDVENLPPDVLLYPPDDSDPFLCNKTSIYATSSAIVALQQQQQQQQSLSSSKFVLLISRGGDCTDETKVYHAQLLGASAAIIYGTLASFYSYTNDTSTTTKTNSNYNNVNKKQLSKQQQREHEGEQEPAYVNSNMIYPREYYDYDCSNGRAMIPLNDLIVSPTYDPSTNDPVLHSSFPYFSGSSRNYSHKLCIQHAVGTWDIFRCASQFCLLTGNNITTTTTTTTTTITSTATDDTTTLLATITYGEACCGWDLPIYLSPDRRNTTKENPSVVAEEYNKNNITIPAAYVKIGDMDILKALMLEYNQLPYTNNLNKEKSRGVLGVRLYQRYQPKHNDSAIYIWVLGCCVAIIASYCSTHEYHTVIKHYFKKNGTDDQEERERQERDQQQQQMSSDHRSTTTLDETNPMLDHHQLESLVATTRSTTTSTPSRNTKNNRVLELTARHSLGLAIMIPLSIVAICHFKMYTFVMVLYTIACSIAITQSFIIPIYRFIIHIPRNVLDVLLSLSNAEDVGDHLFIFIVHHLRNTSVVLQNHINNEDMGKTITRDIITYCMGFTLSMLWLVLSLLIANPEEVIMLPTGIYIYWIAQNILAACICISFLKVVRICNIRVASAVLVLAFLYDILFTFIAPQLFKGTFLMTSAAISDGPVKGDELWCEKYPHDIDCRMKKPLPMVVAIPYLFYYPAGCCTLGLGNIVLPGLLLSFAARYDAAKVLVGVMSGGQIGSQRPYTCLDQEYFLPTSCNAMFFSGYFGPLVVAYAVGLAMAYVPVYHMQTGQPASLYLVPCCLFTLVCVGMRKNELQQLWDGPRILRNAEKTVSTFYGRTSNHPTSEPCTRNKTCQTSINTPPEDLSEDKLAVPLSAVGDDNSKLIS